MGEEVLVDVTDLSVEFVVGSRWRASRQTRIRAVDNASLQIREQETLGLVGESGSGKTTVGRSVLGLLKPVSGSVRVFGVDLAEASDRQLRRLRRKMQIVFQDSYSSLDPSMRVGDIVAEPLIVHGPTPRARRVELVREVLGQVGLNDRHAERFASELSGGQRQRVAIARVLLLRPRVIVCDEPTSALDVSTQAQIVNLLEELGEQLGMSYLFITHDLGVVRHIANRIAVMYLGQIIEEGPAERVYTLPAHPYTVALVSAIPGRDVSRSPTSSSGRIVLSGEMPSPADPPKGCRFHTRCPLAAPVCSTEEPPRVEVDGGGWVSCHFHPVAPLFKARMEQGSLAPASTEDGTDATRRE